MRIWTLVIGSPIIAQAFQYIDVLPSSSLAVRSAEPLSRRLYKRGRGTKQPPLASGSPPAPQRDVRQKVNPESTPGQAVEARVASRLLEAVGKRGRGRATSGIGKGTGRGIAKETAKKTVKGSAKEPTEDPANETAKEAAGGSPAGGSEAKQLGARPAGGRTSPQNVSPQPSDGRSSPPPRAFPEFAMTRQQQRRFPALDPEIGNPSRKNPVQIHTAVSGPAHIVGAFGYNYERKDIHIPEGQSISKLWTDPHVADLTVKTLPGHTGITRAFATGSRRASVRASHQVRGVNAALDGNIAGPVEDVNIKTTEFGPKEDIAYTRVSTRWGPNHVGVDSFSRGPGKLILRASNSASYGESRRSSVETNERTSLRYGSKIPDEGHIDEAQS